MRTFLKSKKNIAIELLHKVVLGRIPARLISKYILLLSRICVRSYIFRIIAVYSHIITVYFKPEIGSMREKVGYAFSSATFSIDVT